MAYTAPTVRATGDLITAAIWNADLVNNLIYLHANEFAVQSTTSSVTLTAGVNTEASPLTIFDFTSLAFDGSQYAIEILGNQFTVGASGQLGVNLWEDSTDLGRVWTSSTSNLTCGLYGKTIIVPTAASHRYYLRGWAVTANGTLSAGSGSPAGNRPLYGRILKAT